MTERQPSRHRENSHTTLTHGDAQPRDVKSSSSSSSSLPSPIAICGLALRLPGGIRHATEFWDFLLQGRDARRPVPASRYNAEGFGAPAGPVDAPADGNGGGSRPSPPMHGYFLEDDLADLDNSFFSFSKDELEKTDPQQRQLLEVVRECLENAGEVGYRGASVGCYVGAFTDDWAQLQRQDLDHSGREVVAGHVDLMIANRISYEYDLRGPSLVVKTGCSASLVALHEACRALQAGDCDAAVVGATNLIMSPALTVEMSREGIISPTGSCRTFDTEADGFARAEAINAVYIKRLDDALRDGNPVRAVIRNTAVNSGGRGPSLMSPNGEAHERLMRSVYSRAGLDPAQTAFVEVC